MVPWLAALVLLASTAGGGFGGVPTARADGDPASDILLEASVFFPYSPATSGVLMRRLSALTVAAARAGAPIKVALIATPVDLGAIPSLFGRPRQYASFLDQEISFEHPEPLLVVMPVGYGTASLPPAADAAVAKIPPPHGRTGDALASAAVVAVERIAAAEGHPLGPVGPAGGPARTRGGSGWALPAGLAAALILGAGAAFSLVRRRRRP